MAKTGINFERCNVGAVELHNDRAPEYLESVKRSGRELYIFQDRQHLNRSLVNPKYEGATCAEIFEKQKARYKEKVGQEPNLEDRTRIDKKSGKQITVAGWSPIREGVCPIKEDTKLEDFKPFIEWCNKNGLTVIRIDLHYDEGYESEIDGRKYNRHAHIVVDWMNWQTAKTAKLGKDKMSEAQDVIADALGMERGVKKEESGKKHINHAEYREKKAEQHALELEKANQKLIEDNEQLNKDNDTLRQANTGISAKYIDSWKWKIRCEKSEKKLENERKIHSEELIQRDTIIAEIKKELSDLKDDYNKIYLNNIHITSENQKIKNNNKKLMEQIKSLDMLQERAVQSLISFGKSRMTLIPDALKANLNNYFAAINPKATSEHRRLFAQALVIDCIYAVDSIELKKLEKAAHEIAADVPVVNRGVKL